MNWNKGDRVAVAFEDDNYTGVIQSIRKRAKQAVVLFDSDQEEVEVSFDELIPVQDTIGGADTFDGTIESDSKYGFNHWGVEWDKDRVRFKFDAEGAHFYGYYRKTRASEAQGGAVWYAIDIYVRYFNHEYAIESIPYEEDPRQNMRSLNSDICARASQFFFNKVNGTFKTLEELRRQAEMPVLQISRLETIDSLIIKLKEFRDTAIRCGGQRSFFIEGDNSDTPRVRLAVNLTTQAMLLKDKSIPSLTTGVMLDGAVRGGDKTKRTNAAVKGDSQNVLAMCKQYEATDDEKTRRTIRKQLRQWGYKGGPSKIAAELSESSDSSLVEVETQKRSKRETSIK